MLEVPPPPCTSAILYLSFNHPGLSLSPPLLRLLSLSPTRFTQNTFLSFIFSPYASYSSHRSSSSSSSLPVSFWTFLLVLSVSLHLALATHPPLPPLFPLWWMSLSAGCSSYLLSRGAHTVSLSRPPHLYPSTKETEGARGYGERRGGGRPRSQRSTPAVTTIAAGCVGNVLVWTSRVSQCRH